MRDVTLARKRKTLLLSTSDRYMVRIVDGRLLAYIPIFRKDLAAANKIFGPDFNALNGMTVSHKIPELQVKISSIPVAIMSLYC